MEHVEDVWYFVFGGNHYYPHGGMDDFKFAARSLWQAVDYAAELGEEWADIVKFNGTEFVNVLKSTSPGRWYISHEFKHGSDARTFETVRKAYAALIDSWSV